MLTPAHRCLPSELRPLANKFYRSHRSPMRARAGDEVWVAQHAGEIIAALCLTPVAQGQWLTSLFVAPEQRRARVACALLKSCLAEHPEKVWLFCHPDLQGFYQRQGFGASDVLPAELAERLLRYQRSKSLVALSIH